MSGGLDISGGGSVAVDTTTLREAAQGFARLSVELDDISVVAGWAASELSDVDRSGTAWSGELLRTQIREATAWARKVDADLRAAAAVYEAIELRARRAVALSAGDADAVALLDAQLAVLETEYPGITAKVAMTTWANGLSWPAELVSQIAGGSWLLGPAGGVITGGSAYAIAQIMRGVGAGTIPRDARLRGGATSFRLDALRESDRLHPPSSLAEAAERVPGGGASRIRVERYSMPDGTRQFAVYVSGMQSFAIGGDEPFDMLSNVQLYSGERSASYEATLAALREAGAEPGDILHAFGHSQGGMIATHIALESDYTTRTLVSFGSPVEADLGVDTLSVSLRHRDDPVAALQGGGHDFPVGAPGSFVAERTADPETGLHDLAFPAHVMEGYTETAKLLDESADPRMDAVRDVFASLESAESVHSIEFSVQRVSASSSSADEE